MAPVNDPLHSCSRTRTGQGTLWNCIVRLLATFVATILCAACASQAPEESVPPEADVSALSGFKQRVDEYAGLRRKLEGAIPALPTQTTEEVVRAHTRALAQSIAAARARAQEGDLFIAGIRPLIERVCNDVFTGPDGEVVIAEIREESDELTFRAKVNDGYPDEAPLAWMPFGLLSRLPPLPEALRYRFLGNDLILLDEDARVIADVLRDVLPR